MAKKIKRKTKPSVNIWRFHCEEYCIWCKNRNGCSACKHAKRLNSYERRGGKAHRNRPPVIE